jgi:hypothetical protein
MKIRTLQENEELKDNEYIIETANCSNLAIKLDKQKIHNLTYNIVTTKVSENDDILKSFINKEVELFYNVIETEIQYVLDTFALVFCTVEDDLKHIRKNFYKFNNKFEKMIALLISRNVKKVIIENYKEELKNDK